MPGVLGDPGSHSLEAIVSNIMPTPGKMNKVYNRAAFEATFVALSSATTFSKARWEWTVVERCRQGGQRCACGCDIVVCYGLRHVKTKREVFPVGRICVKRFPKWKKFKR